MVSSFLLQVHLHRDKVTWPGAKIQKPGEGMPNYENNKIRGTLYITVDVKFPKRAFSEQDSEGMILFLLCGIIFGLGGVLGGVRYSQALFLVSPPSASLPSFSPSYLHVHVLLSLHPFLHHLTITSSLLPPFLSTSPLSFHFLHYLTITSSSLPPFLSPSPLSFHFLHYLTITSSFSLPSSPPPLSPFISCITSPLHHHCSSLPPSFCFITSPLHHLLFCRSD